MVAYKIVIDVADLLKSNIPSREFRCYVPVVLEFFVFDNSMNPTTLTSGQINGIKAVLPKGFDLQEV